MREGDDAFEALRDALDDFAVEYAPKLVAEARAEAVSKVRSMLAEAMAQSLLHHAGEQIGPGKPRPSAQPGVPGRRATPPADSSEPPQPRARSTEPRPEFAYYVYGVVWATGTELPEGIFGVDPSEPAILIEQGDLAAVTSRVSLAEFGEEELRENLNDVTWLEEKARAHERVLDAALARVTVVPLRLCTIYRSEKQVRDMLSSDGAVFSEALDRLEGHTEWGVKLVAEPEAIDRAAAESGEPNQTADAELAAGAAYMRERSRQARARELRDEIAEEWAQVVHETLAARASEALRNPLQNPELSGEAGEMLLNGVYLVDDNQIDAFRQAVDELDARFQALGGSVELTGPWPPYNFVKGSIEAAR